MPRFSSRTALVTGAGSGIGRILALALAAEGARVVVAGRRPEPSAETVRLLEEQRGKALAAGKDRTPKRVAAVCQRGRGAPGTHVLAAGTWNACPTAGGGPQAVGGGPSRGGDAQLFRPRVHPTQ